MALKKTSGMDYAFVRDVGCNVLFFNFFWGGGVGV